MHPDTRLVSSHMKEFGLSLLGRSIYDATFNEMFKPFSHASTVTLAAQGAEILIKARIAEEHPLLIFSKLPSASCEDNLLGIEHLFDSAKSYTYEDLPNLLWATVGVRIGMLDEYKKFGKLRNKIMHFAVPNIDLSKSTLIFIMNVMEPLIEEFWHETSLEYAMEFDDDIVSGGYLKNALIQHEITLTPNIVKFLDEHE